MNEIKLGDKVYLHTSRGTVVHLYTENGERRAFVRMESDVKVQAAVADLTVDGPRSEGSTR